MSWIRWLQCLVIALVSPHFVSAKPNTLLISIYKESRRLRNEHIRRAAARSQRVSITHTLAAEQKEGTINIVSFAQPSGCQVNITTLKHLHAEILETSPDCDLERMCTELLSHKEIETCEPDYEVFMTMHPNDEYFESCEQWSLTALEMEKTWDIFQGSGKFIVGVMDSGMDMTHPDIKNVLWTNSKEPVANLKDDDDDGFMDDVHGWDGLHGDGDPKDMNGHGTHCGGIIGANRNNEIGISGMANVKLMPLQFLGAHTSGSMAVVQQLLNYGIHHGAKVFAMQFGTKQNSANTARVIQRAAEKDVLLIISAGNDGTDNDVLPFYPCDYDTDNIICVGATDRKDKKTGFSNYGVKNVDVFAPGHDIRSTWPDYLPEHGTTAGDQYKAGGERIPSGKFYSLASGTSQAAPHVSGLAALVWDLRPDYSYKDVVDTIFYTADTNMEELSQYARAGRINPLKAVAMAAAGIVPKQFGQPKNFTLNEIPVKTALEVPFAVLTSKSCTETLPFGPGPVNENQPQAYLTTTLAQAPHKMWRQSIMADGKVPNMEILWKFDKTKTLAERFSDAVDYGEHVEWDVTSGSGNFSVTGTWYFSDSAGNEETGAMLKKFAGTGGPTGGFSAKNGAWGAGFGIVNGNCVHDPERLDRRKCPHYFYGILDDYAREELSSCNTLYTGSMDQGHVYVDMRTVMYLYEEKVELVQQKYEKQYCDPDLTPFYGEAGKNWLKNNWQIVAYAGGGGIALVLLLVLFRHCFCHRRSDYHEMKRGLR